MSADETTDDPGDDSVDEAAANADASAGADGPTGASVRPSYGPVIALGLAVAVAIGAIVVSIVGGDAVSATAVRVNSTEVSQKTFNGQLSEIAQVLRKQGAPATDITDAFLPSSTAAQLAQVYVGTEVLRGHVAVSAADRRDLVAQSAKSLAQYDPDLRERLIDLTLMQNALIAKHGQAGATRFLRRLARRSDIHVDARYGFWNPARAQVCPPTGCSTATSGG